MDAIAYGLWSPGLQAKLRGLEAGQAELASAAIQAVAEAPTLHPNLVEVYRMRAAALRDALSAKDAPDALEAARALIDQVIVHPPGGPGEPPGIELVGQLMAMLRAGGAELAEGDDARAEAVRGLFAGSAKEGWRGQHPPQATVSRAPRG